jgi:hypothetical protein
VTEKSESGRLSDEYFVTLFVISTRSVILTRTKLITTVISTHTRVISTHTSVMLTRISVIMTLIRVKTTICVIYCDTVMNTRTSVISERKV